MSEETKTEEQLQFGTDVSRLLDIVANALYSNRDVFLRELISNAADACDRLRYDALQNPDLLQGKTDFAIHIQKDTDNDVLMLADNGIGMNREELIENLGTIARSGTAAIMEAFKNSGDSDKMNLIGQFGVGFYASFMVADKVDVISRRAGDDTAWHWQSDGRSGYTIREATAEETEKLKDGRGTHITLHLKNDASDYQIDDKIKQIILTYSDHIDVPVYFEDEENPVNAASALWMRPKNEITEEQYKEFYNHIGHVFDEPLITAHWKAEGKIEYTALLFIPFMRPWNLYDSGRKHGVRLYVKRVFITDQLDTLVYPWLRFLRGIIDSEDLPLNISREMLQHNPVIEKIRRGVTKRILSDLYKLSENDPDAFDTFWHQFGAVLKEGLYDAAEHRDEIFKICRFISTHDGKLTSLPDYISRMKDDQDKIYYISGEKLENLQNSPQLEGFKSRGIEVLFMTDTIDEFWLQMGLDFESKGFQSITKGSIDLSKFDSEKAENENGQKEETKDDKLDALITYMQEELKEDIGKVVISKRLTESPVCLVAEEGGVDMHMERVLKIQQKYDPVSKRVLEINAGHPLIKKMAAMVSDDGHKEDLKESALLLYDQALIIQGEPIPDPSRFARRLAALMEKGLAA